MKKFVVLFSSVFLFQGCASVTQPVAKRALVEHEYSNPASSVSSDFAKVLQTAKNNDSRVINNQTFTFGQSFFSASGLNCRKVAVETASYTIYCKRADNDWYQVNRVISEYSDGNIKEAK